MNREDLFHPTSSSELCSFCTEFAQDGGIRAKLPGPIHDSELPSDELQYFIEPPLLYICKLCAVQIALCLGRVTWLRHARAPDPPPDDEPSSGGGSQ